VKTTQLLSGTVSLCLLLGFALIFAPELDAASPVQVTISIDTSGALGPIDLTRYALGQGGLSELPMIDAHVDQIRQLHPQTINFFVQEYFDLYPAHGRFHWVTLDKSIRTVLATGAKPIMNLCFKPKVLYPKIDDTIVDPADYREWEELIYQLVRHCNHDQGFDIEYWLVANEGDIGEPGGVPYKFPTPQIYLAYYHHTVTAIRRADPKAKVGGPAPANYQSPFVDALIDSAGRGDVPLDFLCFHLYHNDPEEFGRLVDSMRAKLARHPRLLQTETMIDQWNMSLDSPVLSPYFQPAFILQTTRVFYNKGLSRSSYYHIRDYFVDPSIFSRFLSERGTAFMARWWNEMPQYDGLYDNQGRVRPAYYTFKLLSLIKGQGLPVRGTTADLNALAARGGSWVNVLLWNFPPAGEGKPYEAEVKFPSEKKGRVRLVRLNPESAVNNLVQVRNGGISELVQDPLRVTLRPYEIYWIEVTE
jgi:xylan 1,4-beta-xylosidase